MIKAVQIPDINHVPQWKQFYFHCKTLNKMIKVCIESKKYLEIIQKQLLNQQNTPYLQVIPDVSQIKVKQKQKLQKYKVDLQKIIDKNIQKIYFLSSKQKQKLFFFVQYKVSGLIQKVKRIIFYSKIVQINDLNLTSLIENTYTEIYLLKIMVKKNLIHEEIVFKNIKLVTDAIEYQSDLYLRKMIRFLRILKPFQQKLQMIYIIKCKPCEKNAIYKLFVYGDTSKIPTKINQFRKLGFTMSFLIIATIAFNNITVQSNKNYHLDFPIWRGASYFIAFQWILAFSLMFLEKRKINYKIILRFQGRNLPHSKMFLFDVHILTLLFLMFFTLYMVESSPVMETGFRYFGHIMWLIQIIYFLFPLPFTNYQRKAYFLKLLAYVALSPFPFIIITLPIIWMSEQGVSFSQPISDLICTVYKTFNIDWNCFNFSDVNLVILSTIFVYSIVQNTRAVCRANWKLIPLYYGILRAFFALITVLTSYFYRKYQLVSLFVFYVFYLISAVVSTSVAIYTDIKADWGLLSHKLLRKNLLFANSPHFYYFAILIDIILRCNWTLNMSPSLVKSLNILPNYLIMVISYLQLFRRGLWNILRLQNEHVSTCKKFSGIINDQHIEKSIRQQYSQNITKFQLVQDIYFSSIQTEQQKLIQEKVHKCNQIQKQNEQFVKKSLQYLQKLKNNIKNN